MICISDEHLVTLAEAARLLPGRPHLCTLYRWVARGVGGVKLEAVKVGGRTYTSRESLQRFAEACTGPHPFMAPHTARERQRAAEQAGKALASLGI